MTVTERPILFSAPMVRAILAGQKTQTRRVAKFTDAGHLKEPGGRRRWHHDDPNATLACPYGQPGDRLWVREAHWFFQDEHDPVIGYTPPMMTTEDVEYRADGESTRHGWRPSIHMLRWASRITLEITSVRVERLWSSINGIESWHADPFVWVVEFKRA